MNAPNITHATHVQQVYDLMNRLEVTLEDLELLGHVEDRSDDLTVSTEEAFERLKRDGFTLNGGGYVEHYHQATSDYVGEALQERGLSNTGEWRVTIESMSEEYLYEFEEDGDREDAVRHAYALAVKDGLKPGALWSIKSVEAI
jgi:hypothetical protein